MTDLDALRPEVTMTLESVSNLLERGFIDAYDDPAQVKASINAAIRERADLWSKWQTERCFREKAEAELAALKARIAEAPVGVVNVDDRGCEFVSVDFAENTRVRLVVEE